MLSVRRNNARPVRIRPLTAVASLILLSSLFVAAGTQSARATTRSLAFHVETPPGSGTYTAGVPVASQKSTNFQVQVEAEDSSGHQIQNNGLSVTVAIDSQTARPDGAVGVLSGTSTKSLVHGVATFDDLQINTSATYTLRATASGSTDGVSTPFAIVDSLCTPGQTCSTNFVDSNTNKELESVSVGNTSDSTVVLSLNVDAAPTCSIGSFTDPFFHGPAPWTTDSLSTTGTGTKLLVVRIEKAWRQMVTDKGASSYRPCVTGAYPGSFPFGTWNASPLTVAGNQATGLIPDCSGSIPYWCLSYTKSNKSGDVLEGILFPIGGVDPHGR